MDIVERCFLVTGMTCLLVLAGAAILSLYPPMRGQCHAWADRQPAQRAAQAQQPVLSGHSATRGDGKWTKTQVKRLLECIRRQVPRTHR